MWIAAAIAVFLVLAVMAVIYVFSNFVLNIRVHPFDKTFEPDLAKGPLNLTALGQRAREDVRIPSPYGYELDGWFFPTPGATRTVIIVHGVTQSRAGSVKYMDAYMKRGFNGLLYDQRRHGKTKGKHTTYGYYERHDLAAVVDWVKQRFGPDHTIGIHGESMGASTALMHAAIDDRAAFYVADCPYSDFSKQLEYRLRVDYKLPPYPVLPLVAWVCKLRSGMVLKQVSPISGMAAVEKPVFFIHGDDDDYVPKEMTLAMHAAKPGLKKLYVSPQAAHAQSFWQNPALYDRLIGDFLEECGYGGDIVMKS